jgi:hypothetical protein
VLHQRIVQKAVDDGVPLNSHNIASKKQLADMAYSIRPWSRPGQQRPQAQRFGHHRGVCMTDTTFQVVERKLLLTTLLIMTDDGMAVPVGWFVHSNKSEEDCKLFFNALHEATGRTSAPRAVLRDFDRAIANAIRAVWPQAENLGDLWHVRGGLVHLYL